MREIFAEFILMAAPNDNVAQTFLSVFDVLSFTDRNVCATLLTYAESAEYCANACYYTKAQSPQEQNSIIYFLMLRNEIAPGI